MSQMIAGLRLLVRILLVGAALYARLAVAHAAAPEQIEAESAAPDDESEDVLQEPPSFLEEAIATDAETEEELMDLELPMRWRARVGALLLNRPDPDGVRLSRVFPGWYLVNTPSNFNFAFPTSASVDVELRRSVGWADLDFRYFGVQQATATMERIHTQYHMWLSGSYPAILRSSLTSSLQSAEFNLRREIVPNLGLLTGFRYVQFREALISQQDLTWYDLRYDWRGQNELFGWQVGTDAVLLTIANRFRIEGAAKAGIYGNAASASLIEQFSSSFGGFPSYNSSNDHRGSVSFVGDVNLTASHQISRHVSLRYGYQLLWLSGVTTATRETRNFWSNPRFRTDTDSHVFFHGAMVGLECAW